MIRPHHFALPTIAWLAAAVTAGAQAPAQPDPPPQVLTLPQALQYAVEHYPSIKVAIEQVNASMATVRVAKAGYLPRLDSLWQTHRATTNNIFGQLLPQSVIPALSGPVLPDVSGQGVWGSATGALFSWEPLDFGLRSAGVHGAEAALERARADESLTRLDVQSAVGAAFLAVVQAEQAVVATEADLDRRGVLARAARTLADNQLRPGAEASRAEAERAAADTRVIQARYALVIAQTTFARLLGVTAGRVSIDAAPLLAAPPTAAPPESPARMHPLVRARQAAIEAAIAQEDALARTYRPRLYLQSSVVARGSGANPDGHVDAGGGGLGLERANWAAGVQVVLPNLFDFSALRARRSASAALTRAERARHDEAVLTITSQQQAADAMVQAAREVAINTPVQLASARQSEAQARARFDAGLASVVEVADTQGLLAQAEYQDALARIDVWRALLADAAAHGELTSLVNRLSSGGGQ